MLPSLLFGLLFVLKTPPTRPWELHPLPKTYRSEKTALLENKACMRAADIFDLWYPKYSLSAVTAAEANLLVSI